MYRQFYDLTSLPFSLNPDPDVYFFGEQQTTANTILEYGVMRREGILVITGDVGCGKTVLIRHFLANWAGDTCFGVVSNPSVLKETFMTGLFLAFGQQPQGGEGAMSYAGFQAFLNAQGSAGRACVLVVDEAQSLSVEVLEELRLLTNPDVGGGSVQLILVGQPQLQQLLYRPDLGQLLQRVVAHYHLQPFSEAETARYVEHRLQLAGCERAVFTRKAMRRIHQGARGIPRLINMICDVALLYGYTEELEKIDTSVVNQVIADKGLGGLGLDRAPAGIVAVGASDADEADEAPAVPEQGMAEQLFREAE
jgi:type II secretory pathway predicted ATPase ExeA